MEWTTRDDIARQVSRLWQNGRLLSSMVSGHEMFPIALRFRAPASSEMAENLSRVQAWAAGLAAHSKNVIGAGYTVRYRRINHRVLGSNEIPDGIVVETADDALHIIGRRKDASAFAAQLRLTEAEMPQLLTFLCDHPLAAFENVSKWGLLLSVCRWMLNNQKPGIYLREIGLPEIDSKFIEGNRGVLSSLFDLLLPSCAVDSSFSSGKSFARRYGFRSAPHTTRIRLPEGCKLFPPCVSDVSLTSEELALTEIPCSRVYITENLTNFLTLPRDRDSLIIWGAGYGFDNLKDIAWLADREIYYWGDIDTHGFAILSEFREHFPDARSFLMDEATLLAHIKMCVVESSPARCEPKNLNAEESTLFNALVSDAYGHNLRLEQERININLVRLSFIKNNR